MGGGEGRGRTGYDCVFFGWREGEVALCKGGGVGLVPLDHVLDVLGVCHVVCSCFLL
jgi:hypothetical protein